MRLTARQVSHAYERDTPVLRDVDVDIRPGEFVALTGPSGSGKSTLLAICGLLLTPQTGHVQYDGTTVTARQAAEHIGRSIAWMFQANNLLGGRTARDNVAVALAPLGVPWRQALHQANDALAEVGLDDRADAPVSQLSGGEAQRVGVARAIAAEPPLLICDEPTSQLDAANSSLVFESLARLGDLTTTVLVASHDPLVTAVADRTLQLVDGRLDES